jgi:transcriptional regulator with XRE-family HTH domain
MYWYGLTDIAILQELAKRIRERRLNLNLTQQELATRSGLTRTTINMIEKGKPANILSFIQVLRSMNVMESLDMFLPNIEFSAKEAYYTENKKRKRATGNKIKA